MRKTKENKQITQHILMVEPVNFGFNIETSANNHFQSHMALDSLQIQNKALVEFKEMVEKLEDHGVNVLVVKDTLQPYTPDSIFPNNWVSFHNNGNVALYPMFAHNRRLERRSDIINQINQDFEIDEIVDYTSAEKDNLFLEGTGSMILDRENKLAYAAISERTDQDLFLEFCQDFDFEPILFTANQTVENERKPIYHTNVMMCVASKFVVIALSTIDSSIERQFVVETIEKSNKEIIEITEDQMNRFAGNMLEVQGSKHNLLAMSKSAFDSLQPKQIASVEKYAKIVHFDIETIETLGGGSVRCMMAEIFLPQ